MWFKHGLKAQKLLAQGNTLGIRALPPPSPSENGRLGVYHRGQNRYHNST